MANTNSSTEKGFMMTIEQRIMELEADLARMTAKVERLQALVDEWGIEGGPPIKISSHKLNGYHGYRLNVGDRIGIRYTSAGGETHDLATGHVQDACTLDHATIYSFRDALGYSHAYAGVFGKAKMRPLSMSDVVKTEDREVVTHGR